MATKAPFTLVDQKDHTLGYYAEYTVGNLRFDGEYRRQLREWYGWVGSAQPKTPNSKDSRFGYVSVAYRFTKWLEMGTYHSRFYYTWPVTHSLPRNHIFDQAVTARFDLNAYLDLKVEGHFMDGAMSSNTTDRGFYTIDNPAGIAPTTHLVVVRLGYHL